MFDVDQPGQGIVHVIGPELGLSLPGLRLIVCGDSHTCTHGGLGALAFGIGSSELTHVLATQALIQRRPKTHARAVRRQAAARRHGQGHDPRSDRAYRRRRPAPATRSNMPAAPIRELPVEGRLTICNLSIELGAKMGMVAPDEKTFEYPARPPLCAAGRDVGAGG